MPTTRVALLESRVGRRYDRAAQIDAADAGRAAQDAALAGRGERVLVVDVGVRDAHHHVARVEIVERHVDELRLDLAIGRFGELVGLESFHGHSGLMPASFTTRVHFSVSFATNARNLRRLHAHYFRALELEALARLRRIEDRGYLLVQAIEHRRRRAGRRQDAPPVAHLVARHAGLGDRRHLRHRGDALRAADAERLQLARAHVRHHLHQAAEVELHLAGDGIGQRRAAALVLHDHEVGLRLQAEQLGRHVLEAADAGRGRVQRSGFLLLAESTSSCNRVGGRGRRHHEQRRSAAEHRHRRRTTSSMSCGRRLKAMLVGKRDGNQQQRVAVRRAPWPPRWCR